MSIPPSATHPVRGSNAGAEDAADRRLLAGRYRGRQHRACRSYQVHRNRDRRPSIGRHWHRIARHGGDANRLTGAPRPDILPLVRRRGIREVGGTGLILPAVA